MVAGAVFFCLGPAVWGEGPATPAVSPPASAQAISAAEPKTGTDARLAFLKRRVADDPDDFIAWNQLGEHCLGLLRETGKMQHLAAAATAAAGSLKALADLRLNAGGLGLRTKVELAEHRFAAARADARKLSEVAREPTLPVQLEFDATLELGLLEDAAALLAKLAGLAPNALETHARAQRLAWQRGKVAEAVKAADAALAAAAERSDNPATLAWAHVQRGELAFRLGDFPTAQKHYAAALRAAPRNWSAREHAAELQAAEGNFSGALASLTEVIEATGRPELMQAAGDVAKAAGQAEQAAHWHARALEGMKASAERGEALYLHHLAGLYAESLGRPEEAVPWARKDVAERSTAHSLDALAWALNRTGKYDEAAGIAQKALATGTRDPHILYRAGLILTSAGQLPAAREALRSAAEINPRQQSFHFHR
jgi:tetratricopeptide (TPR) repeat protein